MRNDAQMQPNMAAMRNGPMMTNGMALPNDVAKRMMMQGRANP